MNKWGLCVTIQCNEPSMFNYICNLDNGEQMLFNSYGDVANSLRITAEKSEKVNHMLGSKKVKPNNHLFEYCSI